MKQHCIINVFQQYENYLTVVETGTLHQIQNGSGFMTVVYDMTFHIPGTKQNNGV